MQGLLIRSGPHYNSTANMYLQGENYILILLLSFACGVSVKVTSCSFQQDIRECTAAESKKTPLHWTGVPSRKIQPALHSPEIWVERQRCHAPKFRRQWQDKYGHFTARSTLICISKAVPQGMQITNCFQSNIKVTKLYICNFIQAYLPNAIATCIYD